jgi:AraC-like DNA-binding protein
VESAAQLYWSEAVHIPMLCTHCGISERVMRNAFRAVHGKTPYRYLRERRMAEARSALLTPGDSDTTVTSVATRFGFFELGRFSVEYRSAYGERPSETLRRTALCHCRQYSVPAHQQVA